MSYMTIPGHDAMLLRGSGADYDGPENDDPAVIAEMDAMKADFSIITKWSDDAGIEIPAIYLAAIFNAANDDAKTLAEDEARAALIEMFLDDEDNWNLACNRVVQRYKDDADDHAAMIAEDY